MPETSYLGVLAGTLACVLACGLVGGVLVSWLPWRQRPAAAVFLSPVLGAAVFALLATLVGWTGRGFRSFPCQLMTALGLAAALWQQRREWRPLARRAAVWTLFSGIASLPLLHQFWLTGSFNPFNDTFMYIVHAQWLQDHGFAEPSGAAWEHPAWAQVAGFQAPHLRMGGSFLLGWMQATAGAEWSCDVYPAVVMLGLICGALSVGAVVLWACPGQWLGAWLAALGAACTLNGFAFGAVHGFLHQTLGIAFATAALTMWGAALAGPIHGSIRRRFPGIAPLAICAAAAVHCYSEFSPFLFAAAGLASVVPGPKPGFSWHRRWQLLWPAATMVLLLVNLEWVRVAQVLRASAGVVAGKPFAWSWLRFPAHALGIAAGESRTPWPGVAFTASAVGYWALAFSLVAVFVWLIHQARPSAGHGTPRRLRPLVPLGFLLGAGALAFIWFRYFATNPWQGDPGIASSAIGQSWHQFKLSNWVSLAAIGLTAVWLLGAPLMRRFGRLAAGLMALWCVSGLAVNLALSSRRVTPFLTAVGTPSDAFGTFRALREAVRKIPPGETILVESGSGEAKPAQLLTYFLHDRKLRGRWAENPEMLPVFLPAARPGPPPQWVIRIGLPATDPATAVEKFGRMTLGPADHDGR